MLPIPLWVLSIIPVVLLTVVLLDSRIDFKRILESRVDSLEENPVKIYLLTGCLGFFLGITLSLRYFNI